MKKITLITLFSFCLSSWLFSTAQPASTLFEVFQQQELLEVTLETNFENILADKRNEDYQPAIFTYVNAQGVEVQQDIKVRQRGKYRRRICEMPPLKLNFDKDELESQGLQKFDKMKLVTYCMDNPDARETIIKEYLAYQLYQELTPYSFRTQLIRLTYVDSENPKRKTRHFGFLIESTSELEARMEAEEIESYNLRAEDFNARQETLTATFQYMIGNADWNRVTMRNVKIMKPNDGGKLIIVPYDFDFSGMVDANYAIPNNNLGLTSIKQRAFLGDATSSVDLEIIQDYFTRKQDGLYELINACKYLNRGERQQVINYLDSYYRSPVELK